MKTKKSLVQYDADTMVENHRSRNWCMVLYPDDDSHFNAMACLDTGYLYAAILHDLDPKEDGEPGELKKPHYHVVLRFPQARWQTAVAKELGIAPNYLQICRNLSGAYAYLCHCGLPDAVQYPHDRIIGPLKQEAFKAMEKESDQNERVRTLLRLVDESGFLDERSFIDLACKHGLVGYALRLGSFATKIIELHNADVSIGKKRSDENLPF